MKRKIIILFTSILISLNINAQISKPSVKIFSNFNYHLSENKNAFKEFEVKRAYLGYSHKFDEKFSTKIILDVGKNNAGSEYTAFLKIASLNWNYSKNLSFSFGMISSKNFKFMEKAWGRRFIEKSALDKYKWASSADAGINAVYNITKKMSFDAQILNGEGYKKSQNESGLFRGGLGITYEVNPHLALRFYQDISPREEYSDSSASQSISTLAISYSRSLFSIGAESNMMQNANNDLDEEQELISLYSSYKLSDKYTLFARYDNVKEENKLSEFLIYGIEREMIKGVTVALNVQSSKDDVDIDKYLNTLFLNIECKF
jgi:hypothetical protein